MLKGIKAITTILAAAIAISAEHWYEQGIFGGYEIEN
jgi:hypothetical protein